VAYLVKAVGGAAIFIGSVVLFNVELLKLLDVGTCASGGPYVSARPCPDGTGTSMLLMIAGVFGGLIGATIFALRGAPPGSEGRRRTRGWSSGLLAWSVFFCGTGAVSLYAGLADDSLPDDSALGALIVGATFLLMGLPVLAFLLWQWIDDLRNPPPDERFQTSSAEIPTVRSTASGATDPGWTTMMQQGSRAIPMPTPANATAPDAEDEELDTLVKLERLQKLRESGALTDAEFEAQKKRVLGD
jgi:hypothetical protein